MDRYSFTQAMKFRGFSAYYIYPQVLHLLDDDDAGPPIQEEEEEWVRPADYTKEMLKADLAAEGATATGRVTRGNTPKIKRKVHAAMSFSPCSCMHTPGQSVHAGSCLTSP